MAFKEESEPLWDVLLLEIRLSSFNQLHVIKQCKKKYDIPGKEKKEHNIFRTMIIKVLSFSISSFQFT